MCFCRKILPNIWENHEFGRIDRCVSVGKFSQIFERIIILGEFDKKVFLQNNSLKYLGESSFWENLTKRCFCRKILSNIWENREFGRIDRDVSLQENSPKYLGEFSPFLPNIWENLHHFSQIFGRIQCSSAVAAAAGMLL